MNKLDRSIITDLDNMPSLALDIAKSLKIGNVIELHGDLGAGKTTIAGMIINCLLEQPQIITSPTFNILHQYNSSDFIISHFDLYRINSISELEHLGLEEALQLGVSIIEWPDLARGFYRENSIITLRISFVKNQHSGAIDNNLREIKVIDKRVILTQ